MTTETKLPRRMETAKNNLLKQRDKVLAIIANAQRELEALEASLAPLGWKKEK